MIPTKIKLVHELSSCGRYHVEFMCFSLMIMVIPAESAETNQRQHFGLALEESQVDKFAFTAGRRIPSYCKDH